MPTYTIRLRINVPSVGETMRDFPGIVAPSIPAAIELAKAGVIVEAIAVTKTAT